MERPKNRKRALITGVGGQDGFYLANFLSNLNYEVFGLIRGQKNESARLEFGKIANLRLIRGDLTDLPSLIRALEISAPDEVYNLGAMSFVGISWSQAAEASSTLPQHNHQQTPNHVWPLNFQAGFCPEDLSVSAPPHS